MTAMDVKGVSWVGNMCQRFEAMCVDVDEKIYEETFVHVGNQMRTVGDSVKKFYSEFMQDLLASSSLDSAKEKNPPVATDSDSVICVKLKRVGESKSVDTTSEKTGNSSAEEKIHLNCRQEEDHQLKSYSDLSNEDSVEELTRIKSRSERDESFNGDINLVEASAMDMCELNDNEVEIPEDVTKDYVNDVAGQENQPNETSLGDVSTELYNSVSPMKAVVDTSVPDNMWEVDEGFLFSDTGDDKEQHLKLGESCVLVENNLHFPNAAPEIVQKSYKKKIREAFYPRRWSKPKRDEHQVTGRYEEPSVKGLVSISARHSKIQRTQTSESLDSEWEIL